MTADEQAALDALIALLTTALASKFLTYIKMTLSSGFCRAFQRGASMTFGCNMACNYCCHVGGLTLIPGLTIVEACKWWSYSVLLGTRSSQYGH